MADPEKFLERWSRRKREATPSPDAADAPRSTEDTAARAPSASASQTGEATNAAKTAADEPVFDLSKLPSLDSITATSDIRPFLARGVPSDLTRAALRRAWEADPAIRDFVGLQENDWDFNNPNAIAGFGELPAGTDLKQMVARLFGEVEDAPASDRSAELAATEPTRIAQPPQPSGDAVPSNADALPPPPHPDETERDPAATTSADVQSDEFVQDSKNIAMQNKNPGRRKHGSALPE